ncbi:sensor histidine kinase [Nocardioides exalbidus]|uniref:sensor histidine kinase n=1 Tax=Nocardioides exalbidus TaxID=402596 RepID=UPI0011151A81|nr:histidine kinase [Nocardioides exalbidus]
MDDTCDRRRRATLDARVGPAALVLLAVVLAPAQWRSGGPVSALLVLVAIGALHGARSRPLPALASSMALLLVAYVVTDGRQLVPTVLMLLVVGLSWWSGSRVAGFVVTGLATVFNVVVALRIADVGGPRGGPPVSATVAGGLLSALLAAAALAGSVVRVRGQYHRELEARARQLEVERDQQARIAVAEERRRIAREMHDVVAHSITVMVRLSEGVLAGDRERDEQEGVALRALAETGRSSLAEMRRVLGVLSEDDPDPAGGSASREPQPAVADLPRLVERFRAAGLGVTADVDGSFDGWGAGAELAVYRIAQEALTNALRHALRGTSAQLSVRADADVVEVQVSDDGAGTPARAGGPDGRGLAGMAQRVAAWDGELTAGPMDPHGWRVHAALRRSSGRLDP